MDVKKAGKIGGRRKKENWKRTRLELFKELSKHLDKIMLDRIQMSQVRWSNKWLEELINEYKK